MKCCFLCFSLLLHKKRLTLLPLFMCQDTQVSQALKLTFGYMYVLRTHHLELLLLSYTVLYLSSTHEL